MSRRSAERADAVLQATTDLLAEVGFSAMTIDAVAARAHSSKATIYKRWPTKTALVVAVAAKLGPIDIPVLDASYTLAEALTAITAAVRSITVGRFGQLVLALDAAGRSDPAVMTAVAEHLAEPLHLAVSAALDLLKQTGRIDDQADTFLAARMILSAIVDRALARNDVVSADELASIVREWLLPVLSPQRRGTRTPGPTAGPG
ncbi:TetR/AcrR family transcriptional regulator [Cryobacterium sp. TMB1-7]|uniref:TetR/AcrR family transcriptional regulator n=1 Tax=Cryobacterium sp. TMB1-7 TaxID=2555866 RepID=UPI00106BC133|nr:TetR family transcriptional regulator [Cryobacterium sp. TMB1-7]TFC58766.1 TetR/AcrR family transcriptional regulator [Cryobacterium sp. TMB1-7]